MWISQIGTLGFMRSAPCVGSRRYVLHGSWNRNPPSGYEVIFVPFVNGHPSGEPETALTGFVNADGEALGRPVGVAADRAGALLVANDEGNTVWRVTPAPENVSLIQHQSSLKEGNESDLIMLMILASLN
jgi:hypothetical protein